MTPTPKTKQNIGGGKRIRVTLCFQTSQIPQILTGLLKKLQAHPHPTLEKQGQREPLLLIRICHLAQVFRERKA